MSQDDEFSISELRRKRERASAGSSSGSANTGSNAGPEPQATNVGPTPQTQSRSSSAGGRPNRPATPPPTDGSDLPVDPWRILGALKRHWFWPLIGAAVIGGLGLTAGLLKARSEISILLVQPLTAGFDGGVEGQTFKLDNINLDMLMRLVGTADFARRVGAKVTPPLSADEVINSLTILPQKEAGVLQLKFKLRDHQALVSLANTFAAEVCDYTKELRVGEISRLQTTFNERLKSLDADLLKANEELVAFQEQNKVVDPALETAAYTKQMVEYRVQAYTKQIELDQATALIEFLSSSAGGQNPIAEQIQAAQAKLRTLRKTYTDQHFEVKSVMAEIAELEREAAQLTNGAAGARLPMAALSEPVRARLAELNERKARLASEIKELDSSRVELQNRVTGLSAVEIAHAELKGRVDSLRTSRLVLSKRLREVDSALANTPSYFKIHSPVTPSDVDVQVARSKAISFGVKGAMLGFLGVAVLVVLGDLRHQTMKTIGEVERITKLRVLASLGDLDKMTPAEQEKWAFRAWTIIAGQLSPSANHGMVCGFMSSVHGEGRSTWIRLLGNAASQRGLRVLTIATKPSGSKDPEPESDTAMKEKTFGEAVEQAMADTQVVNKEAASSDATSAAVLSSNAFAFPAEVTQKFIAGEMPAAHIPLPGWVWNLDRRKQWQTALAHWRSIDNLVLLVELPPASVPEAVLLAENLPQIVWLVDSGKPQIRETKEQLDMLRHAKCRIVGAVLNHEPDPIIKL